MRADYSKANKHVTLSLGKMDVVVDAGFPRIIAYKLDGEVAFWGQETFVDKVKINQKVYQPTRADARMNTEKTAIAYTLFLEKKMAGGVYTPFVALEVEIALMKDGHSKEAKYTRDRNIRNRNIVTYRVTAIHEFDEAEKVETLAFTNQTLITLSGDKGGYGAVKAIAGSVGISEVFKTMEEIGAGESGTDQVTYPLIYTDKYVAAISNNVAEPIEKIFVTEDAQRSKVTFTNGSFTYGYGKGICGENEKKEALPFSQIIIGRDENGDGKVDLQDAGILLREII